MTAFNEQNTVQEWLVERLVSLGWEHVSGSELPRERTDPLCEEWVIEALETLNVLMKCCPRFGRQCCPPHLMVCSPRTSKW